MATKLKYVRFIVALGLLAVGLVNVSAMPEYQYWRTYYTTAAKTTECGYANVACNGTQYSGCFTSPYYTDEFIAYCGSSGSDCEDAKVGSECDDNFNNGGHPGIDMGDPNCWPCYSRFETL